MALVVEIELNLFSEPAVSAFITFISPCWKRTWKMLSFTLHFLCPCCIVSLEQLRETTTHMTVSLPKLVNHQNSVKGFGLKSMPGPTPAVWVEAADSQKCLMSTAGSFNPFSHSATHLSGSVAWGWLRLALGQVARCVGLFAYPTVKVLSDWFLGRRHDGYW